MSHDNDWSPDEPLGTESFEQGDEALDESSRTDPEFIEEVAVAQLTAPPKATHPWGTKAVLSPGAQAFLGREHVYVQAGVNADNAFRLAVVPPSR